jgi:hypothetical protein
MSDELRTLFDRFEADSLAQTQPPGARAVQRTVRRRYGTRAVLVLAAAAAAIVWALAPGTSPPRSPEPIGPTSSPSAPGASPTAHSSSTPPAASASAKTGPSAAACDPSNASFVGQRLANPSPDVYQVTAQMLAICPDLTVRVARATYIGKGASITTLTRTGSTSVTLTATNPSATLSTVLPAPSCESVLIVVYVGASDPPSSVANVVPNLSAGDQHDLPQYLQLLGANIIATSWQAPAC